MGGSRGRGVAILVGSLVVVLKPDEDNQPSKHELIRPIVGSRLL